MPDSCNRTRGKIPIFLGMSLLLHLSVLAALLGVSFKIWVPSPDITWLDLDNKLGAPRPKEAASPLPAAPALVAEPARDRPRPKKKRKKRLVRTRPDAGVPPADQGSTSPFTTDQVALNGMAPGDAALLLLLRMDRIRKSPYEAGVRRLLQVFYDHKTLLWSSGLDPIDDLEALLIATPKPYRVTRTFLAARHRLPHARVRRAVQRATRYQNKRIRWSRHATGLRGKIPSPPRLPHDPRVVILQRELFLLTDPAHLDLLSSQEPHSPSGPDAGPDAGSGALSWIEQLRQMDRSGGLGGPGPAMLLQAENLPRLVRLPPDMPVPLGFKITVPAQQPSKAESLLIFSSPQSAKAFLAALPVRMDQARQSLLLRFLGVIDLLQAIRFTQEGAQVKASVELSGDQVRSLLEIFRNMIPQVQVPGMNQTRLPDSGPPSVPDASPARLPDAGPPSAPDASPNSPPESSPSRPAPPTPPEAGASPSSQPGAK